MRTLTAIPVYNEEAIVPELLRRTGAVLDRLPGGPHQIILADEINRAPADAGLQHPTLG